MVRLQPAARLRESALLRRALAKARSVGQAGPRASSWRQGAARQPGAVAGHPARHPSGAQQTLSLTGPAWPPGRQGPLQQPLRGRWSQGLAQRPALGPRQLLWRHRLLPQGRDFLREIVDRLVGASRALPAVQRAHWPWGPLLPVGLQGPALLRQEPLRPCCHPVAGRPWRSCRVGVAKSQALRWWVRGCRLHEILRPCSRPPFPPSPCPLLDGLSLIALACCAGRTPQDLRAPDR